VRFLFDGYLMKKGDLKKKRLKWSEFGNFLFVGYLIALFFD